MSISDGDKKLDWRAPKFYKRSTAITAGGAIPGVADTVNPEGTFPLDMTIDGIDASVNYKSGS